MMEGAVMILTDADRWAVLARYRQLRAKSPNPPQTAMQIIRDCAAEWVCRDVAAGRDPWPADIKEWAVAEQYCRTMWRRPAYWRGSPQ